MVYGRQIRYVYSLGAVCDSALTDYKAANTKAGRDLVKEFLDAFREEEIKTGLYFSYDDMCVEILEEIGAWMEKNGGSIYDCGISDIPKPEWGRYPLPDKTDTVLKIELKKSLDKQI